MEENKDLDKAPASITEKFKMEPPAGAWNALDAELERRSAAIYRKKANHFRKLSIGLALLLLSFVSFYYLSNQNEIKTEDTVQQVKSTEQKLAVAPERHDELKINDKNLTVTTSSNIHNTIPSEKSSDTLALAKEKEKKVTTIEVLNVKPVSQARNVTTENKSRLAKAHKGFVKSNTNVSKDKIKASSPPLSALTVDDKQHFTPTREISNTGDETNQELPVSNEYAAAVPAADKATSGESDNKELKEDNASTENSPVVSLKEKTDSENPIPNTASQEILPGSIPKDSVLPTENSSKSKWILSAFYSPRHSRNHLKDNNVYDAENPDEYNSREKPTYTFETGLTLAYHLTDRWSIATGVSYSTLAYEIIIPNVYVKKGSDNKIHYQYPTSCGIISMPGSNNYYIKNGDTLEVNADCNQILKFIKIPFMARFEIPSKAFLLFAEAGASANFLLEERAKVRVGNSETTVINNIDGLKKTSYSYLFGIGVEYRFKKSIGIFIEPVYSGAITSLTHDISLNCYPYSFGLNTGISLHF